MTVDALKLLRELIAIPSVNPMRVDACGDVERGVAEHLEAVLRREGIECERQHVSEGREEVRACEEWVRGTDGSKLALKGIETVVCGPGDIALAHTRDESIEVEQVEQAVRLYARLLECWEREPGGARAVDFEQTEAAR